MFLICTDNAATRGFLRKAHKAGLFNGEFAFITIDMHTDTNDPLDDYEGGRECYMIACLIGERSFCDLRQRGEREHERESVRERA